MYLMHTRYTTLVVCLRLKCTTSGGVYDLMHTPPVVYFSPKDTTGGVYELNTYTTGGIFEP